jgi:3-oxoacyl-[acyl-carrier-protein] synthase-1
VLFILSTTKGNVELLDNRSPQFPDKHIQQFPENRVLLSETARQIARHIGFTTQPLVVSNACISGLSAQITAMRLLESGAFDIAVVCGADVQSRFIISGFSSFKALSPMECRPFDIERVGLNLGEAAATIVFARKAEGKQWAVESGAVRNDAFHISSPSKNGEGATLALAAVTGAADTSRLAFVNAHGTATMFNDQMESVAIGRAGLAHVPVNAYKGYYGHTLGAAGGLATVLSMAAADDHTVLATKGFGELGVSGKVMLSAQHQDTDKESFVKMISGFGGCKKKLF